MNEFQQIPLITLIVHGSVATMGGIVHALDKQRKGQTKNILDVFILAVISSFSGVIFSFLALYIFDNQYLTLALAGSGGYLGIEGLSVIANRLQDILIKKDNV